MQIKRASHKYKKLSRTLHLKACIWVIPTKCPKRKNVSAIWISMRSRGTCVYSRGETNSTDVKFYKREFVEYYDETDTTFLNLFNIFYEQGNSPKYATISHYCLTKMMLCQYRGFNETSQNFKKLGLLNIERSKSVAVWTITKAYYCYTAFKMCCRSW